MGEQITIYIGAVLISAGLIGNGMNILIFSSTRIYRSTPSSFYFLAGSAVNIIYILINLLTRVIAASDGFDLTRTSLVWCKARSFFNGTLGPISLTCSCLATIDQFFVTSQKVNIRRLSNIKWTHKILVIAIIIWSIHGIFGPIFYNITSVRCSSTNPIYAEYATIYIIVILCFIPVSIMILFGCLTHRNLCQTIVLAAQHADHQLAQMTFIQIILIIISITPYGINSAHRLNTTNTVKDNDRQIKENFATTMFILISYLYYIVCLSVTFIESIFKKFSEFFSGEFLFIYYFV